MLVDLSNVPVSQANQTVDWLCKSMEESMADDPHPTDPLTGAMEDATTLPVKRALLSFYDAVLAMLITGDHPTVAKAKPIWLPRKTLCDQLEQKVMRVQPGSLTFTDYLDVIDCLILKYVRQDILEEEAKVAAIKQYLVGHLRATGAVGSGVSTALTVAALPKTIEQALAIWHDLRPYDRVMIEVAQANAARLVTDLTASARSKMKRIIVDAAKRRAGDGTAVFNPQPLSQQLQEAFGDLNRDWRRVAVTETAINAADGFLASLGTGSHVRWVVHPGCCDYCKSMKGRVFRIVRPTDPARNDQTDVWVGKQIENVGRAISKRKRLDDGTMADRDDSERIVPVIPAHPHCILPDQIISGGSMSAAMQSLYEGLVIEITTMSGRRLSVTENHPVLTPDGFRLAKFLRQGDYVIACPDSERMASSVDPNDYQVPTRADDLFAAIRHASSMSPAAVPASAEDFYGDGRAINGDINIVYADRFLRLDQELVGQPAGEHFLGGAGRSCKLPGEGMAQLLIPARLATTAGFIGSPGKCAPLGRSASGCKELVGGGYRSRNNFSFQESLAEGRTTHSQYSRKFLFRFASQVPAHDDGGQWGVGAYEGTAIRPEAIAKVRGLWHQGYVYDFSERTHELYSASGIIVKNCRCIWVQAIIDQKRAA